MLLTREDFRIKAQSFDLTKSANILEEWKAFAAARPGRAAASAGAPA